MWQQIGFWILSLTMVAIGITHGAAIEPEPFECECYNSSESVNPQTADKCDQHGRVICKAGESDKMGACFTLWNTDNVTGEVSVEMKGCFTHSSECTNTECLDSSQPGEKKLNFCCCKGLLCNKNFSWQPTAPLTKELEPITPPEGTNVIFILIACTILAFLLGVLFAGIFLYKTRKSAMFHEIPTTDPELSASNQALNIIRPIQLLEMKARGRFGAVWRAQLKPDDVAVKIFPLQDKDSWLTEQEIFKQPRMKHLNILEFIGVEKHQDAFWLITAYHSYGSLCDYLKSHTVTWDEMCRISESMVRGLMHLHEEIHPQKGDGSKIKPAIAHRDFKSKNVLLKSDMTACIADFGLALIFKPDVPIGDTHGQVGTRRYMAPEVLEGAINFTRDAFLRIDVYACALVLWELVSRCTAHGAPVNDYRQPFEAELGPNPTLDEMQESIVIKKLRPHILDSWRTHCGLNAMCDTLEECWDHDAEARLTASCVIERISQHTRYAKTHLIIEANADSTEKDHIDNVDSC